MVPQKKVNVIYGSNIQFLSTKTRKWEFHGSLLLSSHTVIPHVLCASLDNKRQTCITVNLWSKGKWTKKKKRSILGILFLIYKLFFSLSHTHTYIYNACER